MSKTQAPALSSVFVPQTITCQAAPQPAGGPAPLNQPLSLITVCPAHSKIARFDVLLYTHPPGIYFLVSIPTFTLEYLMLKLLSV